MATGRSTRLAVILAREGSKRIPGKNIRPLHGKPLIGWVLSAATDSGCFDKVLVSTDSRQIADIARLSGAWVPFLRPPELATDGASSTEALWHAVDWVQQSGNLPDLQTVCLIQPTSPFLTSSHIQQAVELFDQHRWTSLGSMCRISERPEWMFRPLSDGRVEPLNKKGITAPASSLPILFKENGALFIVSCTHFVAEKTLYNFENHGMYEMSPEDSVDIDTPFDWFVAETLFGSKRE